MQHLCLPAAEQMSVPFHLHDVVLPLARGVYRATVQATALWLAVRSDGRYWVVLDEGIADPFIPARLYRALRLADPIPSDAASPSSDHSRRVSRAARVLPFRPRSGSAPNPVAEDRSLASL